MLSCNNEKSLHIAMYSWFALSHLTSFLRLANKLAERGHKISFFLPAKTQTSLSPHNHHPNLIVFIPITVPSVDGLPDGAETTNDVPASARPALVAAMDLTHETIDSHLASLKPHIIFFDFVPWMPDLARKHQAKSIYHTASNLVRFAYLIPRTGFTEHELMQPPPGFPSEIMRLQAHEARILRPLYTVGFGGEMPLLPRIMLALQKCDAIGSKTCREMEGIFCDFLEKKFGKPLLLAGPLVPELPDTTLDEQLDGWLKGFSEGSVVYCALGSECSLKRDQFQELVLGLELTGRPFLAALKPPIEHETIESALPEGFLERTKGRGIVHGGWVQQPLILQHPSIGCFVTHCGAGSLSEAILSRSQLVLLPQAIDHFINARMMALKLRVGVEIEKGEDDGFFTREAVRRAITTVMRPESEVGREVRENHTKWREIFLEEGFEDSYMNGFIQILYDLVG